MTKLRGSLKTSEVTNPKFKESSRVHLPSDKSTSLTKFFKLMDEEPSRPVASSTNFFHSMAFVFIFFPLYPSKNSLTIFSTSSLLMSKSISMLMTHSLQVYLQFVC